MCSMFGLPGIYQPSYGFLSDGASNLIWSSKSLMCKAVCEISVLCHVACIFEPHELIHLNEIKSRVHSSGQGRVTDVGSSR